jgi:hypothetical protein
MSTPQKKNNAKPEDVNFLLADPGNASNPSPHNEDLDMVSNNQFLSKGAEKYIREGGNIEDIPDAQDQEEMNETIEEPRE